MAKSAGSRKCYKESSRSGAHSKGSRLNLERNKQRQNRQLIKEAETGCQDFKVSRGKRRRVGNEAQSMKRYSHLLLSVTTTSNQLWRATLSGMIEAQGGSKSAEY